MNIGLRTRQAVVIAVLFAGFLAGFEVSIRIFEASGPDFYPMGVGATLIWLSVVNTIWEWRFGRKAIMFGVSGDAK